MQFHRTSWTIRPARTWLCERGQTWRSAAPRRAHLSLVSPGVVREVKLFPWATGKKVGGCNAFASVTHCRLSPCTWASTKGMFWTSEAMHCSVTYTEECSDVAKGVTFKMQQTQQIRTDVELGDFNVALRRLGNRGGIPCTPLSYFASYAWKYFLNVLLTHEWNHLFVMQ
jgi:hypothetical protein